MSIETETIALPPLETGEVITTEANLYHTMVGVGLLAIGLDFTDMTPDQHDQLNLRQAANMLCDENYRRWRYLSGTLRSIFSETKRSWGVVNGVKSSHLWGPIGTMAHYMTHLDSETAAIAVDKLVEPEPEQSPTTEVA